MSWLKLAAGLALLAAQLGAVVYARFIPARYFCWAPFDMQTEYVIETYAGGHELSADEIRRRYRRPKRGVDNRSVQNLLDIIQQIEARRDREEGATVRVHYRINGKEPQEWQWP